jgi:NCAIR mutase (PurE)-related protein
MDKDDVQKRILEEEDYIRCPKCSNSIVKFVAKNPDGVENNVIGRLLAMSEEKIEEIYKKAIEILKKGTEDGQDS